MSVTNLRVDVDASPYEPYEPCEPSASGGLHASPEDIRSGRYGALPDPIEAAGVGGCRDVRSLEFQPLSAPSREGLSGTVCIGPLRDQSQVRGVYVCSPRDRSAGTTVAYPAALPAAVMPTNQSDSGLTLNTSSVDAFRADGARLEPTSLGDPTAFEGNGDRLLGSKSTVWQRDTAMTQPSAAVL